MYSKYIGNVGEEEELYPPMEGCYSLVSQYQHTDVWTFLKVMIMIEHIYKWYKHPILTYGQCFFLDKCLMEWTMQVTCFGNLNTAVLFQTLFYRRNITQQFASFFMHQWQWVISPSNDNDAELNRQFPFGTDLNKILPDLLKIEGTQKLTYNFHTMHK